VLTSSDQILLRRYLLGDLPEAARDRVEERYLVDAEAFDQLVAAENDLIDAYIRGELSDTERQAFEAGYLATPELRERVEFARALSELSALERESAPFPVPTPGQRLWAFIPALPGVPRLAWAAAIVVLASASLFVAERQGLLAGWLPALAPGLRTQVAVGHPPASGPAGGQAETAPPQPPTAIGKSEELVAEEVTLRLAPGLPRDLGAAGNTVVLPAAHGGLRLRLMLDRDDYPSYEAQLFDAEGKPVLSRTALHVHSIHGDMAVIWHLPARSISPGDYIVELAGRPSTGTAVAVNSYSFHISGK